MKHLTLLVILLVGCSDGQFAGTAGKSKDKDKTKGEPTDASDDEAGADDEVATDDEAADDEVGETDDGADDEGDIVTTEEVATLRAKCGTADEQTKTVTLAFPATEGTECKWGQDGNLSKQSIAETRAVLGQPMTIATPAKSVLCSVGFNGGSANVRYDDFMHFTFDGFILASVQFTEAEFLAMGMEKTGDLIKYDRLKHIGHGPYNGTMNSRTNSICPKTGTCSMVQSQTAGTLSIDAPKTWFDLLPAETLKLAEHDMTVWVTGQGNDTDCQHTGLNFELTLKYVTK